MRTFLWVSAFILISSAAYGDPVPAGGGAAGRSALGRDAVSVATAPPAQTPGTGRPMKRERRRPGKGGSAPVAVSKPAPSPLSLVTAEDYFRTGMQKYYSQDHGTAVALLCQYVSLLPDDSGVPAALLVIGRGYAALKRPLPALEAFGQIIDRFSRSREALWSIAAMAEIGLENPSLRYPP